MNEILFESMSYIDDEFLEKSEKRTVRWQKWTAVAAVFCLIFIAVYAISLIPHPVPLPNHDDENDFPLDTPFENVNDDPNSQIEGPLPPIEDEITVANWDAVYNDVDSAFDASMQYVAGYFQETLSDAELLALRPGKVEDWMNFSGFAGFDGEGNLLHVYMNVTSNVPDSAVKIAMSSSGSVCDYIFSGDTENSEVNGFEVVLYRWERSAENIFLGADTVIDGVNISFSVTATSETETQIKADFERIIELFTYWFDSAKLSAVKPDSIPEWKDESLSLSEAYKDEDFGAYMPTVLPEGFVEESVRRYKNYQNDYLSGLWTKGYAEISWRVSYMTADDENRLTSVETVENYDLSLYPIPMAQSVPDELREIVNHPIFDIDELTLDVVYARSRLTEEAGDISGYRTGFDVRFGDILIRIRTKGVAPEWIYGELTSLK